MILSVPQVAAYWEELEKISGVLPEFLDKPRKGEFLDPRSDDFAKNQAFGRGVGASLAAMPVGAGLGMIAGGSGGRLAGAAGASGLLAAYLMYNHKLRQFRKAQGEGKNPATGRKFNPEKIERTRKWVESRSKKKHASVHSGEGFATKGEKALALSAAGSLGGSAVLQAGNLIQDMQGKAVSEASEIVPPALALASLPPLVAALALRRQRLQKEKKAGAYTVLDRDMDSGDAPSGSQLQEDETGRKHCVECGAQINADDKHCRKCGARQITPVRIPRPKKDPNQKKVDKGTSGETGMEAASAEETDKSEFGQEKISSKINPSNFGVGRQLVSGLPEAYQDKALVAMGLGTMGLSTVLYRKGKKLSNAMNAGKEDKSNQTGMVRTASVQSGIDDIFFAADDLIDLRNMKRPTTAAGKGLIAARKGLAGTALVLGSAALYKAGLEAHRKIRSRRRGINPAYNIRNGKKQKTIRAALASSRK